MASSGNDRRDTGAAAMANGNTTSPDLLLQPRYSFHIPNFFARALGRTTAAYETIAETDCEERGGLLSGQDDARVAHDEANADDRDGGEEIVGTHPDDTIRHGVEETQAWLQMSRVQRVAARVLFGMLGAAVLLSFNAIITPSEFYRSILKGRPQERSVMSWIIVVYNVASIVFGAHATSSMHKKSVSSRIMSSASVIIVVLVLTTLLAGLITAPSMDINKSSYIFPVILSVTFILAVSTAYLQLAVVTLANAFGAVSMTAMLSGQGLVGAIVSIVQLATTLSGVQTIGAATAADDVQEAHAAASFYGASTFFMMTAVCAFIFFIRTKVYAEMQSQMGRTKTSLQAPAAVIAEEQEEIPSALQSIIGLRRYMSPSIRLRYDRIMKVQRHVTLMSFCIAYIFSVTLAVFPALTSRVQPGPGLMAHSQSTIAIFVAWHFVAFNTGDLVGRALPGLLPRALCLERAGVIALLTVLRTVFIPILVFCNVDGNAQTQLDHMRFSSAMFFTTVCLLGLSNGFLATSVFVVGPNSSRMLRRTDERALAAGLLSWWLTIGLAIGSIASFAVGSA